MNDTLENLLLGVIEGVTEFLPISSTGHLLIAEHWLGARSELFTVTIQVGAILGVVVIYWQRLLDLVLRFGRPENRDYFLKLAGSFLITGAGGFAAMLAGQTSRPAAAEFAFLVGIPTMFAASGYLLLKALLAGGVGAGEDWAGLAIAFVASAVVAFASVKWLLVYIRSHRFTAFAWYRIAFGVALLVLVHS